MFFSRQSSVLNIIFSSDTTSSLNLNCVCVCAGWVAVTAGEGEQLVFRVHGPVVAAFSVRMPPLLPHVVSLKGERIRKSAAYKTVKPAGLLEAGLSARGAERLQVKRKKK